MNCTAADQCSTSTCVSGSCTSTPISCDDKVACTADTCNPTSGCVHTIDNSYCSSPDPCLQTSCDAIKGCVNTTVSCPATGLRCTQATCVSYQGCTNISVSCNKTSTDACVYAACKEDPTLVTPCVQETLVCGAPIVDSTTIVAAAVGSASAAIVAGAVCAAVVVTGVAGGAAVAVYRQTDGEGVMAIGNYPLFVASGNSGSNPLATGYV
jgi:hypothetical protein